MFNNKRINMILALIVAIGLWAFVLGEINPESTVTVRDIPITFANQDVLEESGLTMLSSSETSVNISISGKRTAVTRAEQSDFSVTADLEALSFGKNTVRLNISGPDDVKIESVSVEKVSVEIDELVTVEKDIDVVVNGEIGSDREAYIVETSDEKMRVSGAKTLVNQVAGVNALLDAKDIGDSMKTFDAVLVPVDSQGAKVENINLGGKKVKVTAVMFNKKTVHLDVPIINQDYGDVERNVTVPKTIVIKGTEEDLKGVGSITCSTLDLSRVNASATIDLEPVLPEGIYVSDESANLSASVTVKSMSKAEFSFSEKDIKIVNRKDGLNYKIADLNFNVEATGKESVISGLSEADFTISIDVGDLDRGTHSVTLEIVCGKGTAAIKASVEKAEITVE